MVPSLPLLSCGSSVSVKKTLIEKKERFAKDDIRPCPEKQRALQEMKPPNRKEDVTTFSAML